MLRPLVIALTSLLFACSLAQAQSVPAGIPYQAVLRDSSTLLANRNLILTFTLFQDSLTVYEEDHTLLSNGYGLVVAVIGRGEPIAGNFAAVNWAQGNVTVQVQAELDSVLDLGEFPLWTTPYSFYSDASTRSELSTLSDSSRVVTPFPLSHLIDVHPATADTGQVLTWDGTTWLPANLPGGQRLYPGAGITFDDSLVVNLGDLDGSDDIKIGDAASGDLSGSYPNPQVTSLRGRPVQNTAPSLGQVLKWNGGEWAPANDENSLSPWTKTGSQVSYLAGNVNIGTSQSSARLSVGGSLEGFNGSTLTYSLATAGNAGEIATYGPSGVNLRLGTYPGNANLPNLELFNTSGNARGSLGINSTGGGELLLDGGNGQSNVRLNALLGFPNNGYLSVNDLNGNGQAGMYVNSAGQGVIFGDQKNFRMPHPTQPDKEIWYGSLEGPELAAYTRGTAQLVQGEAWIAFPEHFQLVANASTMTVSLTPLDRQSEGLAVIDKSSQGFRVAELRNGQGNYAFDWEVKCVRQGREDFEVIREAGRLQGTNQ